MRITKYRTELDADRHNILVKESAVNYNYNSLDNPSSIENMINDLVGLNRLAEEYVYMVALSTSFKVLGIFEVSHGSVNLAITNPREIFIRILLSGASSFVICHNHPSGACNPSQEDIKVTKRLKDCAALMGVSFIDHIIIGSSYYSFKENRYM